MRDLSQMINDAIYYAAFRTVDAESGQKFTKLVNELIEYFNKNREQVNDKYAELILKLVAVQRADEYIDFVIKKSIDFCRTCKQ